MATSLGFCRHCGQQVAVETSSPIDQETADRGAEGLCHCSGAIKARAIEKGRERLEKVTGPDAYDEGFTPLGEGLAAAMIQLYAAVVAGEMGGCAITLPDSKLTMRTGKAGIEVSRNKTVSIYG